ncbi:hypothetical protein Tco_0283001 [Tanacetum coccineum]
MESRFNIDRENTKCYSLPTLRERRPGSQFALSPYGLQRCNRNMKRQGSCHIGRQEEAMEHLKENSSNWKFVLLVNLLILPAYTCVATDVVLLCFVLLGNEQSRG